MINNITIRTIQSGTTEEMYCKVTDAALYMATAGFLSQANELLSELWKYRLPHERNTWLPDRAFMMLWHVSNNKPDFVPFDLIDIDEVEKYHRGYVALDKWGYEMEQKDWKQMKGTDLLRTAFKTAALVKKNTEDVVTLEDIIAINQGKKKLELAEGETYMDRLLKLTSQYNKSHEILPDDEFPSKETELSAAEMLTKLIQEGQGRPDALCLAAELEARNGKIDKAIYFAKLWAERYHENCLSYSFSLMACNRHVAPLLLQNVIAAELKVSESICNDFVFEAIKVLDKRIELGRSLVYGNLTWKQLLKKLSVLAFEYAPDDFPKEVHKTKWLGFEKATVKAIKATEKRLGLVLPEDYKSFLKITNGLLAFPILNPALLPVEKIDYLSNVVPADLFKIYKGFPINTDELETFEDYISRCILISQYPEEQMIWLIPPKEMDGTWQTWFFANWTPGENRYTSFRYFIEEQIQKIEKE